MYWTYYSSAEKIPVTSDDVVFLYDEIAGDKVFQSSGYPQQFTTMDDGSVRHIDIVKIDEKRFDFVFPRIVAEPLLAVNMNICPSFIYRPAKEAGGVEAVKNIFSIASSRNHFLRPASGISQSMRHLSASCSNAILTIGIKTQTEAGNLIPKKKFCRSSEMKIRITFCFVRENSRRISCVPKM